MIWPRTEKPPWKGQWGSVHALLGAATSTPMSLALAIVNSAPHFLRPVFRLEHDLVPLDVDGLAVDDEPERSAGLGHRDGARGGLDHECVLRLVHDAARATREGRVEADHLVTSEVCGLHDITSAPR